MVADAYCRYQQSARYDEVVRIRTRIAESRNRIVKFAYEVFRDADGELLASGDTTHIICGANGRPKLLPQKYRVLLAAMGVPNPDRREA